MSEQLSSSEWDYALYREAAYNQYVIEIFSQYKDAPSKASVTDFAQIFVDENQFSKEPRIEGRVDAYQIFLDEVRSRSN